MAQVTVTAQYVADTASYVRAVRQATDSTNEFARNLPQVEQAQDKVKTSTIALGAALGTLGAQVFARATGAVMKYAQQGIAAAKQYEQTVISIEGIFAGTGMSMEEAATKTQGYLADLRDFAAKTPFELPQTLDAVKRLLSIGYAADDVKDRLLPTIGDIVSALGQPPSAISAVVYAFGQMKSAGRVLSQDLMQIGNALPGFNAKMAIANELFQGDFGAMTKAMESGALDSSRAIDVIITAMQKFGGASGAMARQSETLAGVMSTFSDTVNNALIDGLMPSLPLLSAALNEVMPAVEDLATSFAQALGPALIDGAAMMGQLAPAASAILPPLIELISQVTVLGDVFMALSPLIIVAANAVGAIANLLNMLPSSVFAAVGAIVLFRLAMKKMSIDTTVSGAQVSLAFTKVAVGATMMTATVVDSLMSKKIAMQTAAITAKKFQMGAVFAFRAVGTAAKGMIASLGPVGIALVGATVAMEIFMGKSADTQAIVDELKDTVDETTGAFTELSTAMLAQKLAEGFSAEELAALNDMGLGVDDLTTALLEGGDAVDAIGERFNAAIGPTGRFANLLNSQPPTIVEMERRFGGLAQASAEATKQTVSDAEARAAANQVQAQRDYAAAQQSIANARMEAIERQRALDDMTDAERSHAHQVEQQTIAMNRARESGKKAIQGLIDATEALSKAINDEATYDNARQGIIDLTKELKEGDKKLKGYSQAALDNRAAIRDAAQGYIEYANSLTDPIERQKALEEGQRRIKAAIKEAGLDPKDSDILKTLQAEAEQSGKTVDEFAKQRAIASQYGNDVGVNFIDGIIKELEAGKNKVDIAAGDAVGGMPDAANAAIKAQSPSREAMRVAKNFIDGLVAGIRRDKKLAEREVSELGQGLLDAIEKKLDEFQNKMQAGIAGFSDISNMVGGTRAQFGLPSQIMESFGADASISGVLGSYEQLSGSVKAMFEPFLDAEIVPKKVRREYRTAMNAANGQLKQLTANAIDALKRREKVQEDMRTLDQNYARQTEGINQKYDLLEKAAADNVRAIESHYARLIPQLQNAYNAANEAFQRENKVLQDLIAQRDRFLDSIRDGFRKFVNNLKVDAEKVTRTITKTTQEMRNGISILTEETFEVEETTGGGFAGALQGRLDAIRKFATDVNTLLARGVDPTLVQDFVSAGLDQAGDTVAAIAAGTDAEIAAINTAQSELAALTTMFQQTAAQQWFNYGIAQQQAIVAPLQIAAEQARVALEQAQIARDTELAAARAHQETLRLERQAELEQARIDYETQKDELIAQSAAINDELNINAANIEAVFLALRDSMKKKMIPTGRRIINGIIKGLEEREGALYAKARAIADTVRSTIEAAFRIASPSKVTTEIGRQIAEGLVVGMEDGMKGVAGAALGLAKAANPGLSAGQYTMNAGTGSAGRSVVIREGAVQINIGGSMDDRSAAEIQAIVDESLMRLAREIRRT